jgi:hypothetical protein
MRFAPSKGGVLQFWLGLTLGPRWLMFGCGRRKNWVGFCAIGLQPAERKHEAAGRAFDKRVEPLTGGS